MELILHVMLVIAAACVLVAAGLVAAAYYLVAQARKELLSLRRGPRVQRDGEGRPLKERA